MNAFEKTWQLLKKDNPLFPERNEEIREVVDANMAEQKKPKIDAETGGPQNASIRALLDRARGVPRKETKPKQDPKLKTQTLRNLHSKVKRD